MPSKELHLSVIDQTILRVYVRHLLFFAFPDPSVAGEAILVLANGLQAAIAEYPFLAGTVGPADPRTGKLTARYEDPAPCVTTSGIFYASFDLADSSEFNYVALKEEGMPPSRFPGSLFCPRLLKSHPGLEDQFAEGVTTMRKGEIPALAAQANFIPGGLVLSVYMHHSVMDGTGIGLFYKRWADNVRTRMTRQEESRTTAIDPSVSRLLLDTVGRIAAHDSISPCSELTTSPFSSESTRRGPVNVTAKIFTIPYQLISTLSSSLSSATSTRISSFTAIAALLWSHCVRARGPVLQSPSFILTTLGIAVDHRKRLGPPFEEGYMGNLALHTTATRSVDSLLLPAEITDKELAPLAVSIRQSLQSLSSKWVINRLALLSCISDVSTVRHSFQIAGGSDFFITSWTHIGADCEWDIPGTTSKKWEFFRKPRCTGDGGIVVLPRRKGEREPFEVLVQLVDEDMERLVEGMGSWAEKVVC
ncbi:hypothetical protein BU26DRAFT_61650 [Trematosphaeria pertusa]|uniref:Trichothecene 3-O-acetyltransferas-like protein n=1 Tax=Trematosphaeria pertusa TaxID=390896 RepID=A0A6A6I983_9PLEO|nr:uncharacterized protein BU26DRAFT_61650 [Trematosphaeria pertusa]KAF2246083.1 hypothetical protein BU26DRAFT_61650 [Trematosphaeria pertusa]